MTMNEDDTAKLAELPNHYARVRYAVEQIGRHPLEIKTADLRVWFADRGHVLGESSQRPAVSRHLNKYLEEKGLKDPTGKQSKLTPEEIQERDAAAIRDMSPEDFGPRHDAPVSPVVTSTVNVTPPRHVSSLPPVTSEPRHEGPAVTTQEPVMPRQTVVTATAAEPVTVTARVTDTVRDVPEQSDASKAPAESERASTRPPILPGGPKLRWLAATLLVLAGVLLLATILAPISLSAQDIIDWADSDTGLGLDGIWPTVVFFALDAAAFTCVLMAVYTAWRGDGSGIYGFLIWVFAGMSAFANFSHSSQPGAPSDAVWFFPAVALLGPFLLEVTTRYVRKASQEGSGKRTRHGVSFGVARWIPGVGSFRDTYGAWRLAKLQGIDNADDAVKAFRQLCPNGSLRIVKRLREEANK